MQNGVRMYFDWGALRTVGVYIVLEEGVHISFIISTTNYIKTAAHTLLHIKVYT